MTETCVRYLPEEEKRRTRELWEEAFPEDSQEFLEYYYSEKMRENRVLVKEEDGRVVSMLHRNPYIMALGEASQPVDYVVAVATAADSRHRGHMRDLLGRMLSDMYEERMPFTFLMPADEAIYRPFQFAFICDQETFEGRQMSAQEAGAESLCRVAVEKELEKTAADYMNEWLDARYQVYCRRDEAYVDRLLKELASEDGFMEMIMADERPVGVEAVWGMKKKEQRLLMTEEGFSRKNETKKPAMMARIAWLPGFLAPIRLSPSCEKTQAVIKLTVTDPLLAQNNGTFIWTIGRAGSTVEPADDGNQKTADAEAVIPVEQLTQWMFGYGEGKGWKEQFPYIETWERVYIDEVV